MGWVVNATPQPLYPRERPGTHCIGGWVSPKAGLDRSGKSRSPTSVRSPDRPARSKSLYRLRYPSPVVPGSILKPVTIYTDMFEVDFLSTSIQILG